MLGSEAIVTPATSRTARPPATAPATMDRSKPSLLRPHSVPTTARGPQGRWTTLSRISTGRGRDQAAVRGFQKGVDTLSRTNSVNTPQQEWKKVHSVHQVVYKDNPNREHPRARLQRILKGLRIIVGFCLALKRYAGAATNLEWTLNEMEHGLKNSSTFNIDFNIERLKETGSVTQPVKHLGQRLRSILYIPPDRRSIEDVRKIFVFLRTLPTFRHWTIPVLLDFCKYAVYQKYEPKQVVIRRGHNPEGYYIILSGTVLVNKWSTDGASENNANHTVFEQTCGEVFGEAELEDNSPRECTVVCRTECELLTATREDYLEVVAGPLHKIMDENIEFLRGLQLFRNFPCDRLSDSLAEFETKLYSKDSVVVPSLETTDNIYIIKSGKCKVVGEIRTNPRSRHALDRDPQLQVVFPEEHERRQNDVDGDKKQTALDLEWETGQMRGVMRANLLIGVREPERLIVSAGQKPAKDSITSKVESWMLARPGLSGVYDKINRNKTAALRRTKTDITIHEPAEKPRDRFTKITDTPTDDNGSKTMMSGISRRIRRISKMAQLKEQKERHEQTQPEPEEEECKQKFVLLDRLGPGAVFGLESVFLRAPVPLSLVSEGAECISISKKFFMKESNPEVLKAASEVIIRYPSDHYIRTQVKERRAWEKYKRNIVQDVLRPRRSGRMSVT